MDAGLVDKKSRFALSGILHHLFSKMVGIDGSFGRMLVLVLIGSPSSPVGFMKYGLGLDYLFLLFASMRMATTKAKMPSDRFWARYFRNENHDEWTYIVLIESSPGEIVSSEDVLSSGKLAAWTSSGVCVTYEAEYLKRTAGARDSSLESSRGRLLDLAERGASNSFDVDSWLYH